MFSIQMELDLLKVEERRRKLFKRNVLYFWEQSFYVTLSQKQNLNIWTTIKYGFQGQLLIKKSRV